MNRGGGVVGNLRMSENTRILHYVYLDVCMVCR